MSLKLISDVKNLNRMRQDIKSYLTVSERATSAAVKKATNKLKTGLRNDARSAGLGGRFANTWRSKVYPENGKYSLDASGFLWSKAPHIAQAFDKGVTIRPGNGRYLAIPSDNVPKGAGYRGRRLTPQNWPDGRLGKLQVVKTNSGQLLLVAKRQRSYTREGDFRGYRKASQKSIRTGNNLEAVVMFFLVPVVKLRKRYDVGSQVEQVASELPDMIFREKQRLLRSLR